jgi:hypothetical protein
MSQTRNGSLAIITKGARTAFVGYAVALFLGFIVRIMIVR